MIKNTWYILAIFLLSITSCGDFNKTEDQNQPEEKKLNPEDKVNLEIGQTIFSIPSPVQMAMDLENSNKPYNSDILHNAQKHDSYSTEFSRAMNMGVYGTDLAYCCVYGMNSDAISYVASMRQMAKSLNAEYAIDEDLMNRFNSNIDNKDSLLTLSTLAYEQVDAYLKDNDNHDIASLVLAGGWIESMYLFSKGFELDNSESRQLQLAQHKFTLQHFIDLLNKIGTSDDYWELKEMLEDIKVIYNEIPTEYEYVAPVTNASKKTTVIKSKSSFKTNLEISKKIAEEFTNLRNYITE